MGWLKARSMDPVRIGAELAAASRPRIGVQRGRWEEVLESSRDVEIHYDGDVFQYGEGLASGLEGREAVDAFEELEGELGGPVDEMYTMYFAGRLDYTTGRLHLFELGYEAAPPGHPVEVSGIYSAIRDK